MGLGFRVRGLLCNGAEARLGCRLVSTASWNARSSHGPIVQGHLIPFIPPHAVSGPRSYSKDEGT